MGTEEGDSKGMEVNKRDQVGRVPGSEAFCQFRFICHTLSVTI